MNSCGRFLRYRDPARALPVMLGVGSQRGRRDWRLVLADIGATRLSRAGLPNIANGYLSSGAAAWCATKEPLSSWCVAQRVS